VTPFPVKKCNNINNVSEAHQNVNAASGGSVNVSEMVYYDPISKTNEGYLVGTLHGGNFASAREAEEHPGWEKKM
jgi:hypothetical protein